MEEAPSCYRIAKGRRVAVRLHRRERRGNGLTADVCEIGTDRAVLLVPATLEVGEPVRLHMQSRKPEVELTAEGEVRWVWYADDVQRRTVCDFTKRISPALLEALCAEGLLQPRDPSTRRLPVEVAAQWEMDPNKMVGTVEAFSRDGFYFLSPNPPKQWGRLMLILDPDEPIQLPARARRQQRLSRGYLLECSFESARGYEILGNFLYPPDTVAPQTAKVEKCLSTFSQCGIVAVLYLSWLTRVCS